MRLILLFLIQISLAAGHGDLHGQIEKISAQIALTPDDPKLWITRANLHQSHRNPKAARLDLVQSTRIHPPHPSAFLKLAQFDRKRGEVRSAQKSLEKYFTLVSTSAPDPQALREKALLSAPAEALESWRLFLKCDANPTMHDHSLAAQSALEAKDLKATRNLIHTGLDHHPKSIVLHQLRARLSLIEEQVAPAEASFQTLRLLNPNLLVKLNYEESLIWAEHDYPIRAQQALLSARKAYHQLPVRLQKNRDLLNLVAKIQTTLRK